MRQTITRYMFTPYCGLFVSYETMRQKIWRHMFAGSLLILISVLAVMAARQMDFGPERPAPAFRTFGRSDAKIHIHEFTDFACPGCRTANERLHKLMEYYGDAVLVYFKHFPLISIHSRSFDAAVAADCAGRQGKFRQYADRLFEKQEAWSVSTGTPDEFSLLASRLDMSQEAFEKCRKDPETAKAVTLDMAEGRVRSVHATPTFFVNRKRLVGSSQLLEEAKRFDSISGR
ncbi:MAG: thioredoxin domain-containing protein [bacterium]